MSSAPLLFSPERAPDEIEAPSFRYEICSGWGNGACFTGGILPESRVGFNLIVDPWQEMGRQS